MSVHGFSLSPSLCKGPPYTLSCIAKTALHKLVQGRYNLYLPWRIPRNRWQYLLLVTHSTELASHKYIYIYFFLDNIDFVRIFFLIVRIIISVWILRYVKLQYNVAIRFDTFGNWWTAQGVRYTHLDQPELSWKGTTECSESVINPNYIKNDYVRPKSFISGTNRSCALWNLITQLCGATKPAHVVKFLSYSC